MPGDYWFSLWRYAKLSEFKSLVLYSQMVGRAIRGPKAGGNEFAEIITVIDQELPGFGDVAEAFKNWEDVWE